MGAVVLIGRRLAVVAAALTLLSAPGAGAASLEGETVAVVELVTDRRPPDRRRLESLLVSEPGRPLRGEEVRSSLRNLHASGQVAEAEAWARRSPQGLALVFDVTLKLRVSEVRMEGETPVPRRDLQRRLVQRRGEALVESRVVRGVYRLQDLLAARGFPRAVVRAEVRADPAAGTAALVYRIEAGPPSLVEEVGFDGDLGPFSPEELRQPLRSRPGDRHRPDVAREDAERLEEWLLARGHRQAVVEPPRATPGGSPPDVVLAYPVQAGPEFEIVLEGPGVERLRRRLDLPLLAAERYDEALLAQSLADLEAHLQERGHYRVRVTPRVERSPGRVKIAIEIEPGPVYELATLSFDGNLHATDAQLARRVTTGPGGLLDAGRLIDRELEADLENLRRFYALEGYRQAVIGPPRVEEQGQLLSVVIPIVEGPRQITASLVFEGDLTLAAGELAAAVPLTPGGPYHPRLLEESVAGVRALYEERGFPSTQVEARVEWDAERTFADVALPILEGPRAVVDRVIVRGNVVTRTALIRRLVAVQPGDVVNTGRLLEAQRRLLAAGVFSRAEVRLGPAAPFAERRDVLVRVEEGRRNRLGYGLGWDSESGVRALLRVSRLNLGGRGTAARLELKASDRDQLARLLIQQPFLAGRELPTTVSLFSIQEAQESFDSVRRGVQARMDRLGDRVDLRLLASFRMVEVENADPALEPLEIDRDLREVDLASVSPGLVIDRRDDPIDPSRGWTASLQAEWAFPLLSARTRFLKLFGQQTGYLSLGSWGVVAASVRAGAIEPIAGGGGAEDPTVPADLPSRQVPIAERFFGGGRSTHRAYERDRLGIFGETLISRSDGTGRVPVGGTGLLLANVDYRFPIAGPVGGSLFVDAGNVWADWRRIDVGQAKGGVGLGLRYLSPIGPLRLEVGWKLDRERGEPGSVVFLSFGNPF
ncbi:MAG: POTRA domain-containing protein [Thermoanaerobaculia bacterium]|nr:POTRA domain-containing protein [Thermoanaerobaculia bacterium]